MTNHEFRERLIKGLQERMPGAVIFPQDTKKNNAVVFSSIVIQDNGSNMAPCICTDGLYYDYQNGHKDMDGVIDSVLEIYGKIKAEKSFNVSELLDYSKARYNLNGRLTNTEKNREILGDLPHRDFLDLSLSYFVDVTPGGDWGCASIRVTNAHMKMWDVTEEDLYRQFRENMEKKDGSRIRSMAEVLAQAAHCLPEEARDGMRVMPMYVLSNARKLDGAVEMLNQKALEKAAEIIGDDFFILPSSIHETILVPVAGNEDGADELAKMVSYVNRSEVQETDVLSDHVYRYRRENSRIELAA